MMLDEASALTLRAREEATARAQRAKDWTARREAEERGPAPLVCPPGATEKQRVAWHSAMGEVLMREKQSKVARGWQRLPRTKAPAGHVPFCCLFGARTVILAIDLRGALRLVEGGRAGAITSVSEACAMAAGR